MIRSRKTEPEGAAEIEPYVRMAVADLNLVDPGAAAVIAAVLHERWRYGDAARKLRQQWGRSMSKDDLSARGLTRGTAFTDQAWAALTPVGRASPVAAYDRTVARARKHFHHDHERPYVLTMLSHRGAVFAAAEYISTDPCGAAALLAGRLYGPHDLPEVPIRRCDSAICLCRLHLVTRHQLISRT